MTIENIKEVLKNVDKKYYVYIAIILCIIIGIAWNVLGRDDVHSDGITVDTVNTGLTNAIAGQQATTEQLRTVTEGLSTSADSVGRVSEELGISQGTVTKISDTLTDSTAILRRDSEIIERDSGILESIRTTAVSKD